MSQDTVIDGHLHVFRAVSERYPRDVHDLFPADLEAPVEDLLASMERAGVQRAVLVPLSPHDEYVRDCLTAHPGRFAAVGVHDPQARDPAADARRRREGAACRACGRTTSATRRAGEPSSSSAGRCSRPWPTSTSCCGSTRPRSSSRSCPPCSTPCRGCGSC